MTQATPTRTDIFCRVIDNFGDIATCWRLARILHVDHGQQVRLWVDDLTALQALHPAATLDAQQTLDGIDLRHWPTDFPDTAPFELIIEAFACELPAAYRRAMQGRPVTWVNLEYMSCEPWVGSIHGQGSMLPGGLHKTFIVPSLLPEGGGLLREQNLLPQRDAFLADPQAQQRWQQTWNIPQAPADQLKLSLFAYENPRLGELIDQLAQANFASTAYLPQSRLLTSLREHLQRPDLQAGDSLQLGQLSLHILPFLPQSEYDRLLWLCDINFVRGEESLSRALWAGKPFIWQIYPTDDLAHHAKLDAFLDTYTHHAASDHPLRELMLYWNQRAPQSDLAASLQNLHQLGDTFMARSQSLAAQPSLAQVLLQTFANSHANGYNAAPKTNSHL